MSQPVRYLSDSGREFDVEISSRRIDFEGGLAVLGIALDVTGRNQSERALKESERQYRHLVERSPDAIMVHQHGAWCFANPAGLSLLGAKSMDHLKGRKVLDSVHPDCRAIVVERLQKEVKGHEVGLLEEHLLKLNGEDFWAEVTAIPMVYGDEPASLVIARDITARQQAEEALRQEKRKMQIILDHAPIGIWMTDLNFSIQLINKAFTDAVGISEKTFVHAEDYLDLLPEDVSASCRASDMVCMQSKQKVVGQEYIPCVDGKVRIFDVIKVPVRDDAGEMVGIVGLSIDASERIEAQAESERMQRQVEHTQRLESLGVLAGGIAHDFNNILAVIMGNAALLKKQMDVSDESEKFLERIVDSSEKASVLCGQMLAYSGQGKVSVCPMNLTEMSQSIATLLEVSIGANVELNYDLDANLPLIDADEGQMQQLVMNLVINASEAMEEEAGHIDVKTCVQKITPGDLQAAVGEPDVRLSEDYVCLQVKDDGCGMSTEVLSRIFEPFFTTKFTGRGLGMSALLGIVRAHHGCLSVRSQQGEGTRFHVFFPVGTMEAVADDSVNALASKNPDATSLVLVIDDDEMIRETVAMMLEDFGYDVLLAENGMEGVEIYRQHQDEIQVVLLDMTMPKMNGLQCFQQLKLVNPAVKVILSSGYQEEQALQGSDDLGLSGYIQKPYRPEALDDAIKTT